MLLILLENTLHIMVYCTVFQHNLALLSEGTIFVCVCLQDGFTALHLAAQEGNVDVVRLLTEAKAHVNTKAKVYTYICNVMSETFHFPKRVLYTLCTWDIVILYT